MGSNIKKKQDVAIVLGSKGVNATGLIRSLGEAGIFVVFASDYSCIDSRWTKEYLKLSKSDTQRINELLVFINKLPVKPTIFPVDDKTCYFLDANYQLLREKCYLPHAYGKLHQLGNKEEMARLATVCGLKVPNLKIFKLDEVLNWNKGFPIIVKPYAGYTGNKGDIRICNSFDEYLCAIQQFREKKYELIMVQEFICGENQYEIGIMGLSLPNNRVEIPGIIKKIRSYPVRKGSTSYAKYIRNLACLDYEKIEKFVKSTGYIGIFDIEMIIKDDIPYFIEINYRNGQYGYISTVAGYNLPAIWHKGMHGQVIPKPENIKEVFYMNEREDFKHVKEGNLSFKQWIMEFNNSQAFGMYNSNDLVPYIRQYVKIPDRVKITINKLYLTMKDLFIREEWNIAYRLRSDNLLFEKNGNEKGFIVLPNTIRYWAADPFVISLEDKTYVFFEMYDRIRAKGLLGYRELTDGQVGKMQIAYEDDVHLSFPFVFEYNENFYMIPESSNNNKLILLKAERFPKKWNVERVLVQNKSLCDSILLQTDGLYMLTQEVKIGGRFDSLDLYYYEDGKWIKSERNPVVIGANKARMAGGIIRHNNQLIRVAQNCEDEYGKKVSFHKIEKIDNLNYEECEIATIDVNNIKVENCKNRYIGIHSYNVNEMYEVIDLKNKNKLRLGNIINVILRILKKCTRGR